jgi:hypothetical protein
MPELSELLTAADLKVTGRRVKASFPNGRSHVVSVSEKGDSWELRGVVLSPEGVSKNYGDDDSGLLDLALRAWQRNGTARLCGFRLDSGGALVGEATVPKIGLKAEELQERVRALARACDLLEAHLTGKDEA